MSVCSNQQFPEFEIFTSLGNIVELPPLFAFNATGIDVLVQTLINNYFVTKALDFVSEMQRAALEVGDHRIIG
jgi:hypothetical protein